MLMDPLGTFESLLLWAITISMLIALAAPMRYVWPCVASFVMLIIIFLEWPFEHDTYKSSPFSGAGGAIVELLFMVMATPIVIKLFIGTLIVRRRARSIRESAAPLPAESRLALLSSDVAM